MRWKRAVLALLLSTAIASMCFPTSTVADLSTAQPTGSWHLLGSPSMTSSRAVLTRALRSLPANTVHAGMTNTPTEVAGLTVSTAQRSVITRLLRRLHGLDIFTLPTKMDWACIRFYESRGNYRQSVGEEPYGGAYQFSVATWRELGFTGLPSTADRLTQNSAAVEEWMTAQIQRGNGWEPWQTAPLCRLG